MHDAGNVAPLSLRRRMRGRIASIAAIAAVAGVSLSGTAPAAPGTLSFALMEAQISSVVEQQSPTYFYAPCSNGAGGTQNCDPSTWVVNSLNTVPCAWDVDDHFKVSASGTLNAGTTATGRMCMVADGYTAIGDTQQDHMLRATVLAPSSGLTVTLRNDRGVSIPLTPQPDGRNFRYYACTVDHTAGPYPEVPGSNGGVGVQVQWQLDVTAGSRSVRNVSALLEHPLIGTQTWFDSRAAGCT